MLSSTYLAPILFANHCASAKDDLLFFIPTWYKYLNLRHDAAGGCEVYNFQLASDVWLVGLAILDMLLRIAGFVAVIMIIVAGVRYIGSGGNPENAASARKGLYNAIIGLFIALTATALVAFIGNRLTTI